MFSRKDISESKNNNIHSKSYTPKIARGGETVPVDEEPSLAIQSIVDLGKIVGYKDYIKKKALVSLGTVILLESNDNSHDKNKMLPYYIEESRKFSSEFRDLIERVKTKKTVDNVVSVIVISSIFKDKEYEMSSKRLDLLYTLFKESDDIDKYRKDLPEVKDYLSKLIEKIDRTFYTQEREYRRLLGGGIGINE